MIVSGLGGGYAPLAQFPRFWPPMIAIFGGREPAPTSSDIKGSFNRTAQDHTRRDNERAGGKVAGHAQNDGPAAGRAGGVDRLLNGRGVVGVTITLGPERSHRKCPGHSGEAEGALEGS